MTTKILVLGIDALDAAYFSENRSMLPHLGALAGRGATGCLRSTIPPLTGPAWVTAFSGMNPAKTGITGFVDGRDGVLDSRSVAVPRVWNVLSAQDRRCAVIGVPMAYPVEEINGIMVGGFMTPSIDVPFTYPTSLQEKLVGLGYTPDLGWRHAGSDKQAFLDQLMESARTKFDQILDWLEGEDWDCFICVLSESDWIQHYLDRPSGHPEHEANEAEMLGFFCMIDEYVGRWVAAAGPEAHVLVCSDHGFGHFVHCVVHVNRFLIEEGYLRLKKHPVSSSLQYHLARRIRDLARLPGWHLIRDRIPRKLKQNSMRLTFEMDKAIDWQNSQARFRSIFWIVGMAELNRGYFADEESFREARRGLVEKMRSLRDPSLDRQIFEKVYLREEAFDGPYAEQEPDIIGLFAEGYGGSELPDTKLIIHLPLSGVPRGTHRSNGVWILAGPDVKTISSITLDLQDIAPTIYHLLGVTAQENMDGRVPREAFITDSLLQRRRCPEADFGYLKRIFVLPPQEDATTQRAVIERLRALGYVD